MKARIMIVVLMGISISLFSQEKTKKTRTPIFGKEGLIKPGGSFEIGYNTLSVVTIQDGAAHTFKENGEYTDLTMSASIKWFKIMGNAKTVFSPSPKSHLLAPWLGVYRVGLYFNHKDWEIGAWHECQHLIDSYVSRHFDTDRYNFAQNQIYVKVKF